MNWSHVVLVIALAMFISWVITKVSEMKRDYLRMITEADLEDGQTFHMIPYGKLEISAIDNDECHGCVAEHSLERCNAMPVCQRYDAQTGKILNFIYKRAE